jgi:DDE_Tnp_1-associated
MDTILDETLPRSRLAVLLKHFSQIEDGRQSWRVAFPLAEMLLLLTCGTIADCDDFDEIVAWAEHHLEFLRQFAPFFHGVPCTVGCGRWSIVLIRCRNSWTIWPKPNSSKERW